LGKQKRLGIYFTYGANWLGGVYYLVNLVNSFNVREDIESAPSFVIFYNNDSEEYIKLFSYPKVEFVKIKRPSSIKGYATSLLTRRNFFLSSAFDEYALDGIYPMNDLPVKTKKDYKIVAWYPDLQHRFYPEYFSSNNLKLREKRLQLLIKNCDTLVLSSEDVKSHFKRFYKSNLNGTEIKVMPFVSLVNKNDLPSKEFILEKYKVKHPFFVVSNQFYKHKDHLTVFRAIHKLQQKGIQVKVLMTGRMEDPRNPDYINELKIALKKFELKNSLELLGVVPRNEQLSLLKNCTAIIQPSLFEGWSTVVEDAKALGASIIASDIEIHKEQLGSQGIFFKKQDHQDLANKIEEVINNQDMAATAFPYHEHIKQLTESFENIF